MKSGFLNNMAPNAQRSFLMTFLFAGLAMAIYMFAIGPTEDALQQAIEAQDAERLTEKRIGDCMRNAERHKRELKSAESSISDYNEKMLEHRLGNYMAHACQILYPLANGAGLKNVKVESEASVRKLPLPNPKLPKSPAQLHQRVGIRMTAQGSFQKAVSLILQLERQQPMAAVREMRISRIASNDKEQQIDITFEWLAVNTEPEPQKAPAAGKGKK